MFAFRFGNDRYRYRYRLSAFSAVTVPKNFEFRSTLTDSSAAVSVGNCAGFRPNNRSLIYPTTSAIPPVSVLLLHANYVVTDGETEKNQEVLAIIYLPGNF